ncbi:hypothetical protein B0H16DRAFT_1542748 [Mycena metata]|uniref:Squalene monooxygenase n=1 Tax=Mycena metata TaxID=1033252 RepID=A0AAD7NC58_9AGAR|nr:hypothetical protein B0H16DRAFT_1542748 [Mycena metata]
MRHPLTGGGMTVGLNDVLLLRFLLALKDPIQPTGVLRKWHWQRKSLASTVNISRPRCAIFLAAMGTTWPSWGRMPQIP